MKTIIIKSNVLTKLESKFIPNVHTGLNYEIKYQNVH